MNIGELIQLCSKHNILFLIKPENNNSLIVQFQFPSNPKQGTNAEIQGKRFSTPVIISSTTDSLNNDVEEGLKIFIKSLKK